EIERGRNSTRCRSSPTHCTSSYTKCPTAFSTMAMAVRRPRGAPRYCYNYNANRDHWSIGGQCNRSPAPGATSRSTISSASVRLQRLRLACRSGARLIPILATRHGRARPGHACLWTDTQSTLNVARHAKKSEVEGEIQSQIEYQEV